ncbi:MAG: aminodeoxychorismate/anthranilate synthase component II [Bacteroidales bacterium]|nr:aminodeoxychorismate/anthranilate synthase component II [Bacteroidales bacterium]
MKIFILDNYDSFTYNLVHIIEQFASEVVVKRNDEFDISEINEFDKIVFSPGPGLPSDVKIMSEVIDLYKKTKPMLGVCLGHQAIAEYFGAKLLNMPEVNHGREFKTQLINHDYLFNNIPDIFYSGRYHSWIVDKANLPVELEITSIDAESEMIMSLRHKTLDIRSVQFHPESIMTKYGSKIIENWLNH